MSKKMHSHADVSDAQNINKVLHYSKSKERQSRATRQMETKMEKNLLYIYIYRCESIKATVLLNE